jgi:hypothetical protein
MGGEIDDWTRVVRVLGVEFTFWRRESTLAWSTGVRVRLPGGRLEIVETLHRVKGPRS